MLYNDDDVEIDSTAIDATPPKHKNIETHKMHSSLIMSNNSLERDLTPQGFHQSRETFYHLKNSTVILEKSGLGFSPSNNYNIPNIPTSSSSVLQRPLIPK